MTTTDSELRRQVQNSETPTIDDGNTEEEESAPPGLDMGISRQTVAILGVVAVVLLLVWLSRRSNDSEGSSPKDGNDDGRDDPPTGEQRIEIPTNPSDELDKDEAVLTGLRQQGVMNGGDD